MRNYVLISCKRVCSLTRKMVEPSKLKRVRILYLLGVVVTHKMHAVSAKKRKSLDNTEPADLYARYDKSLNI